MSRRTVLLAFALLAGCRDVPHLTDAAGPQGDDGGGGGSTGDAAANTPDAMVDPIDGAPFRLPCTTTFGAGLTAFEFGRLDGYLVALVPPPTGARTCHADDTHYHLQVRAGGLTYDIAVNIGDDVHTQTIDHALFAPGWTEGWHTTGNSGGNDVFVNYAGLGIHSTTMPLSTKADLITAITADLKNVNHISIYATSYDDSTGAHLVHYNGAGHDGMIVTQPLSPTGHMRAFSFTADSF